MGGAIRDLGHVSRALAHLPRCSLAGGSERDHPMSTRTSFPAQQLWWRSEVQDAEIGVTSPLPLTAPSGPAALTRVPRARWGWRGAHPGAGVTTLARELGGADLGLSNV